MTNVDIYEAIELEQKARRRRWAAGAPYHYWVERGDPEPPLCEFWCDHCVGYYGVPHSFNHERGLCSSMGRFPGNRQCACIDCVVWEALHV